jgi:hypothetical protein
MPIKIEYVRKKRKFAVINTDTRHVFGWHATEASAKKQMSAMAANGADMDGKGGKLKRTPY